MGPANIEAVTGGLTVEGTIVGTVAYMSPEQAQGKPVDMRSDLFSFGTTFYEMLTGRNPFLGSDNISTLAAILKEQPKSLSEAGEVAIPVEAERILSRCLRKDPERRFQTASDLRAALEDLLEEFQAAARSLLRLRLGKRGESCGSRPQLQPS
jgi:serine/threonine protein kinase